MTGETRGMVWEAVSLHRKGAHLWVMGSRGASRGCVGCRGGYGEDGECVESRGVCVEVRGRCDVSPGNGTL